MQGKTASLTVIYGEIRLLTCPGEEESKMKVMSGHTVGHHIWVGEGEERRLRKDYEEKEEEIRTVKNTKIIRRKL